MIIPRTLLPIITSKLGKNKVLVITGARRTGKTYLLNQLEKDYTGKIVRLNGDLPETTQVLAAKNINEYKRLLGGASLLLIDEAQTIPEVGKILKIIIDTFSNLTIVATGSSSFDLSNKIGEPLTGRQFQFHLYPIWQGELAALESPEITMRNLDERLIFGSYPELLSLQADSDKRSYLQEITSSYLLKDILMFEQIRHSHKLLQLLQLIAFQIGQEVSYDELAKQLGISKDTVTRYLDLLSKIFVIYRVGGYSTNLRKEIIKSAKWYFIDNGIRNAIINNFSSLSMRNDVGFLWENYLMTERLKRNSYQQKFTTPHFWRTYDRQEIDLIENADGKINAFEMKWKTSKSKAPIFFTKSYPEAEFKTISRDNYLDFIL